MAAQSENWWGSIKWIRRELCALLGFHSTTRSGKSNWIIYEWKEIQSYSEMKNLERRKRGAWHSVIDIGIGQQECVCLHGSAEEQSRAEQSSQAESAGQWNAHKKYRPGLRSKRTRGMRSCVSVHMAKVKLRLGLSAWAALLNKASIRPTVTLRQMCAQCTLQQGGPPNTEHSTDKKHRISV